jgi:hypothetical protein
MTSSKEWWIYFWFSRRVETSMGSGYQAKELDERNKKRSSI